MKKIVCSTSGPWMHSKALWCGNQVFSATTNLSNLQHFALTPCCIEISSPFWAPLKTQSYSFITNENWKMAKSILGEHDRVQEIWGNGITKASRKRKRMHSVKNSNRMVLCWIVVPTPCAIQMLSHHHSDTPRIGNTRSSPFLDFRKDSDVGILPSLL